MELGYPVVVKGDLFSKFFVVVVIVCSFYAILSYVIRACALPWFDKVNPMMQLRFESTESFEFGEGKKPNWVIAELAILFFLGVTTLLGRVILSRSNGP